MIFPDKKRPIENLTVEEIEFAIKYSFENGLISKSNLFQSSIFSLCVCDYIDKIEFLKIYGKVIEEYLKSSIIKVENGKILYCNTSTEINPDKEYKEISIACPDEFIRYEKPNKWII